MNTIIKQRFSVPFEYPVCFSENIFDPENRSFAAILEQGKQVKTFFVIDSGVAESHPDLIQNIQEYAKAYESIFYLCAEPVIVPGGETCKNDPSVYEKIVEATHIHGIDRHSYIVAIGGGAVLDMAGFAAAISHRGIRLVRVPTTVLSQNDSGVGVKTSVNSFGKKNYLGTFTPPVAVINDFEFLKTLDDRDWRSGISEAIKVALIKDLSFFEWLEENAIAMADRQMEPMQKQIIRSAQMHLDHIAGKDPFEFGSSRPLDFGHWAAHKLEHLSNYRVRHGEAVALGIALDSTYSYLKGMITKGELDRIITLIQNLGFELYQPELSGENLLKGLKEFQEHLGGQLTIMLLEKLGKGVEVHEMDHDLILQAIGMLQEWNALAPTKH
ncbi:3-dehydroquinate synthase [Algoriphagus zhangzhouensis]|uniref:3-dehydroquinate synthase n=1 Tax=Algoriphagus zhangzhouensis TaxID=1073327 RepID=A0A1M7ZA47_9BACT|nr:3-dehydroquinate synthase [Algoriphagus zhangzhouensis]TDY47307.1 3-dehydroquinate synthase [Algoriphagus zhangzhouensis]SHO61680.1 3-dehydroquinate synthase [Algoriphagus zhangzhouensis]